MNAPIEHGLEATAPAPTKPPVVLNSGYPIHILGAMKRVARKCGWSLEAWCLLSEKLRDVFDDAASAEANEHFLSIAREHFEVTLGERFSWDSRTWDIPTPRSIWPDT